MSDELRVSAVVTLTVEVTLRELWTADKTTGTVHGEATNEALARLVMLLRNDKAMRLVGAPTVKQVIAQHPNLELTDG